MNYLTGPLDPFLDDPASDPATLLAPPQESQPLSEAELADIAADLQELAAFRAALSCRGMLGVVIDCADCAESHYFSWDLMAANLRALLDEGRTHTHEPACQPDPNHYVTWEYARGFVDALHSTAFTR